MKLDQGSLRYAATDLANFTACRHLTRLELAAAHGLVRRPQETNAGLQALAERGLAHETRVLRDFADRGWRIVDIRLAAGGRREVDTLAALRRGADVVYQGELRVDAERGLPDFLVRADLLGDGAGYEVIDAKLARSAKAMAVLQATFYSRLLQSLLGAAPEYMRLALGNGALPRFRLADHDAYERQVGRLFRDFIASPPAFPSADTYPEPVEHCPSCRWSRACGARWRTDDDLSLVAGITAHQRVALHKHGVTTRRGLARLRDLPDVHGVGSASLERVRDQARIQVRGEDAGEPLWEFVEAERQPDGSLTPNRGLLALPEPAHGDLFFDIEGARYYSEDITEFGLQYLFGIVDSADVAAGGRPAYHAFWGFSRAAEKLAFEAAIDFITSRIASHPGAHVYHYNHYEPTNMDHLAEMHSTREEALGRLTGRFATRGEEVDNLLRRDVFVDLYRVVKQGVRASVESYSIKRLEPLCGFARQVALDELDPAIIEFESDIDRGTASATSERAEIVRGYNEDDCRSTLVLREWLEARRADLAVALGVDLPRPTPPAVSDVKADPEVAQLRAGLLAGVAADAGTRTPEQQARALVADLLEYHRREDKPMWWRYFHLKDLSGLQLLDERGALAGLQLIEDGGPVRKSWLFRYRYPPQEHGLSAKDRVEDPRTGDSFTIDSLDDACGDIGLLWSPSILGHSHPTSVIASAGSYHKGAHRDALREIARELIAGGDAPPRRSAMMDLLLRRRPRLADDGEGPLRPDLDEKDLAAAVRCAAQLRGSYLAVQGPPGTGKTFAGAEQILRLVAMGQRVGVTATSHAVICGLLDALLTRAALAAVSIRVGQKPDGDNESLHPSATRLTSNQAIALALAQRTVDVVGATTWAWTSRELRDAVDVLVVDEAGQMCLADVLGSSLSAGGLILLGDPMQLAQPSRGTHPPGAGASGLEHILGGATTMPGDRGLFLATTRRMHPAITAFTSRAFYEGRLGGIEGLDRQAVLGDGGLCGSGLRVLDVEHEGNSNLSVEEAARVAETIRELLARQWRDQDGAVHAMTPHDILVVTPFNAQIREIELAIEQEHLPRVSIGTVDKFQGQEAPVVLYSMASSTAADAPRGLEFLYDPHRLNVATSRARCLAIVVCSPQLARVVCRTPRQIQLVNALCLLREMAG